MASASGVAEASRFRMVCRRHTFAGVARARRRGRTATQPAATPASSSFLMFYLDM